MKKSVVRSNGGFTLVELMVVVAIIGILSAVAIPNFKKYQAKSKTSEAKMALAAIYMSETSFFSDADTYATCLYNMGYAPSGVSGGYSSTGGQNERYYTVGFKTDGAGGASYKPNGVLCNQTQSFYLGRKGGTTANKSNLPGASAGATSFSAGAIGTVDRNQVNGSSFTMNQVKQLTQVSAGY